MERQRPAGAVKPPNSNRVIDVAEGDPSGHPAHDTSGRRLAVSASDPDGGALSAAVRNVIAQQRDSSPALADCLTEAGLVVEADAIHGCYGENPSHPEPELVGGEVRQRTSEGRQAAIADRVFGRVGPAAHLIG
jgi:hypothetical protein